MREKILTMLLCVVVIVTLLPMTVFADTPRTRLDTPTDLVWDSTTPGKVTWGGNTGDVGSYEIKLYKDNTQCVMSHKDILNSRQYDFSGFILQAGAGSYTFTVRAFPQDANRYQESNESSQSPVFLYPTEEFIAVTDLRSRPDLYMYAGESIPLCDMVLPYLATNHTIVWSVKTQGGTDASITQGNDYDYFTAQAAGTATVTATVTNGKAVGTDFTQDYDIEVRPAREKLATPTGLAWDTTIPGKATCNTVTNATRYFFQLYKDGVYCDDGVDVVNYYDFTSIIAAAGTGRYTFKASAHCSGYTDSDWSEESAQYNCGVLGTPTGLAWDTTIPGKATWSAVTNAGSYSVQLYRADHVSYGSPLSTTNTYYDFNSVIPQYGNYYYKVMAISSDADYANSTWSAASQEAYIAPLPTPTGLLWDDTIPGKAKWTAVANTSGYRVQLYKGGLKYGNPVTSTNAYYDFTSVITAAGTDEYTFKVTAVGDGTSYTNSMESTTSSTYAYIAPLSTPTGLLWDESIPRKAKWTAVTGTNGYRVQLYKGGEAQGNLVTTTNAYYDFTTAIAEAGNDSYTFKVQAIGNGTTNIDSGWSSESATVTDVSFSALSPTDEAVPTVSLTLQLDRDISGFSIGDITVTGATKGTLTSGTQTGEYLLGISAITVEDEGSVTVAVSKSGYIFTPAQKSVEIRNTAPAITSVSVTPETANVQKGTTQQFTAAVTGTGSYNDTVTWTVEGGVTGTTISTSGLLSIDASETATTLTVTATSNDDSSKYDTATVTVTDTPSPTPPTPTPTTPTPQPTYDEYDTENNNTNQGRSAQQEKVYVNPLTWNYSANQPNTTLVIEHQGAACVAAFQAATPAGYTEAFSFNLLLNNIATNEKKKGTLTVSIPAEHQRNGRSFLIIGIDRYGKTHIFKDTDTSANTSANTVTINIEGFEGYAFSMIYTDNAKNQLSGKGSIGSKPSNTGTDSKGSYYIVQKGDVLSKIAILLGKKSQYLIEENNMENANKLKIGQKIYY